MKPRRALLALVMSLLAALATAGAPQLAAPEEVDPAGPRPPRRHIAPGPMLSLQAPTLEAPLLSQVRATLRVGTTYTGSRLLTYSLARGPDGMTIDASAGLLMWAPPLAMEGQQATVKVTAGDGALAADVTFTLQVAATRPVTTVLAGSTITVTQSGTLQGVSFTFPALVSPSAAEIGVASVPPGQAPKMPSGVTRLSDFFRLTPAAIQGDDGITVTLPARLVPPGVQPQELQLYFFADHVENVATPVWIEVGDEIDVRSDSTVAIKVYELRDLSFVGYRAQPGARTLEAQPRFVGPTKLTVGGQTSTLSCAMRVWPTGIDPHRYICTVTDETPMTVWVRDFYPNPWQPGATLEELMAWLLAARTKFTGYGMTAPSLFCVRVQSMTGDFEGFLGYTTPKEKYRVLHLTSEPEKKDTMRSTSAHEFFHLAQYSTTLAGTTNIMPLSTANWIAEGTAVWFEDELFDDLNQYTISAPQPLLPWMELGVDCTTKGYGHFAFWKMISSHCALFRPPLVLNVPNPKDISGISNFKFLHESGQLGCSYQGTWGANNSSFIAPLLYYAYATVKNQEGGMSLFDSDEPPYTFAKPDEFPFYRPHLTPSKECRTWVDCPWRSEQEGVVASAGVYALYVDPPLTSTPDEIVQVIVDTVRSDQKLFVWGGQNETAGGLAEGFYSDLSNSIKMTYHQDHGTAPHLLGLIVNPDPAADVPFRACAAIAAVGLTIPTATITIDGNTEDWAGIAPLVTSPRGGGSPDYPGSDIQALYAAKDTNNLYLRMDLWDNANTSFMNMPPPKDGCYRFWIENTAKMYGAFELGVAFDGDTWGVGVNGSSSRSAPSTASGSGLVSVKGRVIELRIPLTDSFRPAGFTKLGGRAVAIGSGDPIRTLDEVSLKVFEPTCHRTQAAAR